MTDETCWPAPVLALLEEQRAMTVAIADEKGPWAAPVYYIWEGRQFFFLSSPRARHVAALAPGEVKPAAVTIARAPADYRQIAGLQMAGTLSLVEGLPERAARFVLFGRRFDFFQRFLTEPALALTLSKTALYRFTAESCCWVDNERAFGERTGLF
ncbi:pyridoxamine 5'-phosphate oxidase family protein [Heliophilum fasciatum]|nr:pyridoxamine 5'-phosphate oxidase family protein [Heliophilum fasciatum]